MPEPSAPPYTCELTFRWGDQDPYGHVNNVQILRILEDARVIAFHDWFAGMPGDKAAGGKTMLEEGVVVARHEIEYLRPLTFDYRPVACDLWVTRAASSSFDLGYRLRPVGDEDPRHAYVQAETTIVLFDLQSHTPRRLAGAQRELVESHLGPAVPFRRKR